MSSCNAENLFFFSIISDTNNRFCLAIHNKRGPRLHRLGFGKLSYPGPDRVLLGLPLHHQSVLEPVDRTAVQVAFKDKESEEAGVLGAAMA